MEPNELEVLQALSALELEEVLHRYGVHLEICSLGQAACIDMLLSHAKWHNRLSDIKQLCQSLNTLSPEHLQLHQNIRAVLPKELIHHPLSCKYSALLSRTPENIQLLNKLMQRIDKLKVTPEVADLLNSLGKLAYLVGDFDNAAWAFEEAAALQTKAHKKAEHYYNAYRVALHVKQWDYALNALKQAIALDQPRFELFPSVQYEAKKILSCNDTGIFFFCKDLYQKPIANNEMADKVVIKSLEQPDRLRPCHSFFPEVRSLQHPNIIQVLHCDFVERNQKAKPFLVMEYFAGIPLSEYIQSQGTLSIPETRQLALFIAQAIQAAHQQNIFHLNLKASNVLLKREKRQWQVKIIDFALALPPMTVAETNEISLESIDIYQFAQLLSFMLFQTKKPSWKHWQVLEHNNEQHLATLLDEALDIKAENRPKHFATIIARLQQAKSVKKFQFEWPRVKCFWWLMLAFSLFIWLFVDFLDNDHCPEITTINVLEQASIPKASPEISNKSPLLPDFTFIERGIQQEQKLQDSLKSGGQAPIMLKIPVIQDKFVENTTEKQMNYKGFAISQYEITRSEFARFVRQTQYVTEAERNTGCIAWTGEENIWRKNAAFNWKTLNFRQTDKHPVVCVSLQDARAYTAWLSKETEEEYRLPTELEWLYAIKANTSTRYSWGAEPPLCEKQVSNGAKFNDDDKCLYTGTETVGSYAANPFGLFDVHGNVWEWMDNLELHPEHLIIRGGSWSSTAEKLSSDYRTTIKPQECCYDTVGFRVVRKLP